MPGQVGEAVSAAWEKIETWYAEQDASRFLLPPATPEEIAAAEKELGVTLPEAVRVSLLRHNGTASDGWPGGTLLSCAEMVRETGIWRELLDSGDFDDVADFEADENSDVRALRRGWWNTGWISLDADGSGNGAVLDLDPGADGSRGQILDMDHEVGPSGPTAADFVAYLEGQLEDLEDCVVVDGTYLETA